MSETYDVLDGTKQSLCEICLNPDSCIISVVDSEEQPEEESSQSSPPSTDTSNEATGRQGNRNAELGNYAASDREREDVLLPKILKTLIFILIIPVIAGVGIIIAIGTMVVGVLVEIYYLTRCSWFFDDDDFVPGVPMSYELTEPIANFVKTPFNQYAYLITKVFCCGDEERESRIISMFCRGVAMVIIALVIFLSGTVYYIVINTIIVTGIIVFGILIYLPYVGLKWICKKIGKCRATSS